MKQLERESIRSHRIAVDLGGHSLLSAHVNLGLGKCDILKVREVATIPSRSFDEVTTQIVEQVSSFDIPPTSLGISVPGMLDKTRTKLLKLPNFPGWDGAPLIDTLHEKLLKRGVLADISLENDANCYALGEGRFGLAFGCTDYVLLTLGTGIGGGIVTGGQLLRGAHGMGGELGHMVIGGTQACGCGGLGHLETLAAADGVEERALSEGLKADFQTIWERRSEERAERIISLYLDALGRAVANLMHLFDPELIILGGGMSQASDLDVALTRAALPYLARPHRETLNIKISRLGNVAALYGAGLI